MASSFLSPWLAGISIFFTFFLQICLVIYHLRSTQAPRIKPSLVDLCGLPKTSTTWLIAAVAWISVVIVLLSTYLLICRSIEWDGHWRIRRAHQPEDDAKSFRGEEWEFRSSPIQNVRESPTTDTDRVSRRKSRGRSSPAGYFRESPPPDLNSVQGRHSRGGNSPCQHVRTDRTCYSHPPRMHGGLY